MRNRYTLPLLIFCFMVASFCTAQNNVGIGTPNPNPSSILDISAADRGVLVPRLTTAQRTAIVSPANGLLVYDINLNCFCYYNSATWISLCQTGGGGSISSLNWSCGVGSGDTGRLSLNTSAGNFTVDMPAWHFGGARPTTSDYFGTANNADIQIATDNQNCMFNPQKQKMIITNGGNVGIGSYNTVIPTRPQNKLLVQNGKINDPYSTVQLLLGGTTQSIGILSTSNLDSASSRNLPIIGLAESNGIDNNTGISGIGKGDNVNGNVGVVATALGDNSQNTGLSAFASGNGSGNVGVNALARGISQRNTGVYGEGKNSIVENIGVWGNATDNNNNTPNNTGMSGVGQNGAQLNVGVHGYAGEGPENQGVAAQAIGDNQQNEGVYSQVFGRGTNTMNSGITTWVEGNNNNTFATNGCYGCNKYNAGVIGQTRGDNSVNIGVIGVMMSGISSSGISQVNSDCIGAIGSVRVQGNHSSIGVLGEVLDFNSATFNYGVVGRQPQPLNPSDTLASCVVCPVSFAGYFEGDVFCAATYYYSDPKLKTNIQSYTGALAKLQQLNIKQYTFKTETYPYMNMPLGQQVGVLSSEMKQVFPNLVKHSISPGIGTGRKDVDFEAVNYNALIPVLVQAVKELDDKTVAVYELKALKADNEQLRKAIEELQKQIDALKK